MRFMVEKIRIKSMWLFSFIQITTNEIIHETGVSNNNVTKYEPV